MRPRLTVGGWGWVLVVCVVVIIDGIALRRHVRGATLDAHTMSRSFFNAISHPVRRWPVAASALGTMVHLFTGWNPLARLGSWLLGTGKPQGVIPRGPLG